MRSGYLSVSAKRADQVTQVRRRLRRLRTGKHRLRPASTLLETAPPIKRIAPRPFLVHHLVRKEAALAIRVLIVDDVPALRELFRLALADSRFQVVGEAGDGVEAVQLARTTRPDVILLDVSMPRMDGLQAIPLLH